MSVARPKVSRCDEGIPVRFGSWVAFEVQVTVTNPDGTSEPVMATMQPLLPGLFRVADDYVHPISEPPKPGDPSGKAVPKQTPAAEKPARLPASEGAERAPSAPGSAPDEIVPATGSTL